MKFRIIYLSLLACLYITGASLYAQKADLHIVVSDYKTGEKLVGATILLDGKPVASTDMDGVCKIQTEAGTHVLLLTYMGYDNEKMAISLTAGEVKTLQLTMKPAAKELNLMVVTGSRYEKNITEET
ncbi:MAG: carboxypeptidase-like regulatory domain-containing protein, partial [Flavobacteriales bacterium]|nr:carboxypeptidase-like regulatory domain-containing protein [Flavobacteriales bacterium]